MPGNNIIIDRNALIADCKSIINRFEEEQENFNKIIKSFENFNNADKLKSDAYKNLSNHLKDYNLLLKSLVNANLLDAKCCEEIITKLNSLADGAPSKLDYDKMGDKLKSLKKERDSLEEKRNKEIKKHESMEMVSPIYITQSKFMGDTQNPLTDGYKYQIGSIEEQMRLLKERRKFCEEVSKVEGVFDSNNNLRKAIISAFEEMQKSFKGGKYNYTVDEIFIRDLKKYNTVVEKNYSDGIIKESTQADINCWIKVDYKMSDSDRKKAQKIVDKYQAEFKKKYNVLQEQSAHGVNIVRTSIWAKMSYEEKLEYEYCMALKHKLSMNNKAYAAGYGLINSILFLPEKNTLIYKLLMDKEDPKDPKVYANSLEGRLKNADIQSDGWCTKGEAIGDIAQVVVPFAWDKLSKAGECVKGVEVASEGEKSVALAEEGIGAASKVEKTAKVTSEVDEAAKVTSKAGKITKGVSKVEEKPIGPQAKLEKVKFKEGRYEHHIVHVEKFTKGGVRGGHNWKKFDDYIGKSEYSFDYHKVSKHPDIDGVYDIEYTLKRPIKDYTGKPIPGEFKHVPRGNRIFKKTVYDPNVISDNEMIKLSKDAMKEAVKSGREVVIDTQNKVLYQGKVLYKGKTLKFEGYKNMNTGEIENAYPVLEWSKK